MDIQDTENLERKARYYADRILSENGFTCENDSHNRYKQLVEGIKFALLDNHARPFDKHGALEKAILEIDRIIRSPEIINTILSPNTGQIAKL